MKKDREKKGEKIAQTVTETVTENRKTREDEREKEESFYEGLVESERERERENGRLVLNVRERDGKSTWSPRGARGCAREAADERETSGDTFMNCPIHGMRILARQTLGVNGSGTVR